MKELFKAVASPITSRIEAHNTIKQLIEEMPRNRVAATVDMNQCFYDQHGEMHECNLTTKMAMNRQIIDYRARHSIAEGMPHEQIRSSLAKGKTAENLRLPHNMHSYTHVVFQDDSCFIESGLILNPQLQIVYVGDYLDIINSCVRLESAMLNDVLLGNGKTIVEILKDFNQLPDYSEYFSSNHRRPPPGPPNRNRKARKPMFEPNA